MSTDMLGGQERMTLQETGELTIDPRVTVAEICDLLSDLGLTLGVDAKLEECATPFGIGFRLTAPELAALQGSQSV
jgi:hypothetical protein